MLPEADTIRGRWERREVGRWESGIEVKEESRKESKVDQYT